MTIIATVYATSVHAVRKTADDCRRLIALMDALGTVYEVVHVDTPEMRQFVESLTSRSNRLPLLCVGEACIGTYDEIMDIVEDGALPQKLREVGYTESIRGGESIPVRAQPVVVKTTVVKKVIVKKPKSGDSSATAAGPSSALEDDDAPPPPPEDDAPPPPPDEDDMPPPPPEDDVPPPPPDDDVPPPPPEDDGDVPPPPPEDDDIPPPPE